MSWSLFPLELWLVAFGTGLVLCLVWPAEKIFGNLRKRGLRKWLWAWSFVVALAWLVVAQIAPPATS